MLILTKKQENYLFRIIIMKLCFLALVRLTKCDYITLTCDEFEREYGTDTSDSFCTVTGFVVSHSQNVMIQRSQKANMTKFMKFYESCLLYVPYRLFDAFPNLKTLDVSFTEILDIPRNTFGSAGNLTNLNMSSNNLTQITTSVFMGASKLLRLDLCNNQISEINEYAFRGLDNLDKLLLSFNHLTVIHKDIFVENPYLETVYLDNNLIEYIEPEVFNRLQRISDVNLSYNKIKHIEPNTFQAAYSLETLILASNQLNEFYLLNKTVGSQLCLDRNNLSSITINGTKFVRADNNRITTIHVINAAFLSSLELAHNNISDIRNITNTPGLLQLDLSFNPIGSLNITTFDRTKRLRTLNLRATGIRHLTFGMFSKLSSLELLDLAYNNISTLNLDIFVPYLANLKQLFIDANNLTEIQGKSTFSTAFQNLARLGLSRNHFNCSYLHTLLLPPSLSSAVTLHIEQDDSDVESSHIRDVGCISEVKTSLRDAQQELHNMQAMQRSMQDSMKLLQLHEKHLQIYLLIMKISLGVIIILFLSIIVYQFWRTRSAKYYTRRGSCVIFQSNATVNTNMEH